MALRTNKFAAATAVAAAFSLLATPVAARDYYGGHHRHHHDDIDTGDVVAGVVLLGAIAALAGAAHNNRASETYRYPPPEPEPVPDAGYQVPGVNGQFGTLGIDRAVDLCVTQLELGNSRVASVDGANRAAEGWRVDGVLENGAGFSCTVGNDSRLSDVRVGDANESYEPRAEGEYSDDYYESARASQDTDDGRYDVSKTADFKQ